QNSRHPAPATADPVGGQKPRPGPEQSHSLLSSWRTLTSPVFDGVLFFSLHPIRAAPSMIKTTPLQRSPLTSSWRIHFAARVVRTKPSEVSGQIRLTSQLFNISRRETKKMVSKRVPSKIHGLVAPRTTKRPISARLNCWS